MTENRPTVIPNFIAASTLKRLRQLMFKNNKKHGAFIKYFDIQREEGRWYAFYYADVVKETEMKRRGVE